MGRLIVMKMYARVALFAAVSALCMMSEGRALSTKWVKPVKSHSCAYCDRLAKARSMMCRTPNGAKEWHGMRKLHMRCAHGAK